jgi:hypothetical protein
MPIPQPLYLNAPTLSQATAIFYDAALTLCADDGYYSDGTIVRYLSGCVLQFAENCPDCGLPCEGGLIVDGETDGYLILNASTGETSTDVGAIIIKFRPDLNVSGIIAQVGSTKYNTFSSPVYGVLAAAANLPIFLGSSTEDCGVSGSTYSLTEYGFDGATYVTTGDTVSVTVSPSQVNITASDPGYCVMVIPKLTPLPSGITVTNITPCSGTKFDLEIGCPQPLKSFNSSLKSKDEVIDPEVFCNLEVDQQYYTASVNGNITGGGFDLGLYDWVFYDAYGQNVLDDGWYKTYNLTGTNDTIEVQNGVIVTITQTC